MSSDQPLWLDVEDVIKLHLTAEQNSAASSEQRRRGARTRLRQAASRADSGPADVAQACKAEAAKTTKLLQDLQTTLASNVNDDPPHSVRATANVVAFTGTNQARRGFIPQAAGVA